MSRGKKFGRSVRWHRLQIRARKAFNRIPLTEQQKLYVLTLLIGSLCGLAAVTFHLLLEFFQERIIYSAAAAPVAWSIPLVLILPAVGGLIAGIGLYFYAPEARGSGIPQVKTAFYVDGGRIPFRVIPGKMFLAALNIGTGASLGREGPTVQICAAIASLLGRFFTISRRRLQNLVPVGAAAGLAAAFNTPIASVTFTLEEILGSSAGKPLGSIVIASVIAAVIERSLLGEHPLFSVPAYRLNSSWELIFYALLGVLAALVSVTFNESLLRLRDFFQKPRSVPGWGTPAVGGFLLGIIGLIALLLTGSSSVFGVGYGQLSVALHGSLTMRVLIILALGKLAATVICYGSGSTGGIFGPSLYIGGMIGGLVGTLAQAVLGADVTQTGAFVLVGMGAAFAGIVRAPVTSIIIIFEMTNNYSMILPLMVANIISYVLAAKLSPMPIYDALLIQDGIHLPHTQEHVLKQISVSRAMTRDVVKVEGDLTAKEAFKHVQSLPEHFHAYPVVGQGGCLAGLITFNDLKRALAAGRGSSRLFEIGDKELVHVHPDHSLDTVLIKLGREGISQLPVVSRKDTTKLLGIITMEDIAEALSKDTDQNRR